MLKLNDIELPRNLVWANRLDYCAIRQTTSETITGHIVIQRGKFSEGRKITLTTTNKGSWLTLNEAENLSKLRLRDEPFVFYNNGTEFNVRFDLSESDHFVVRTVFDGVDLNDSETLCYIEQIKLIEVLN